MTRRQLITGTLSTIAFRNSALDLAESLLEAGTNGAPDDEDYWRKVRSGFDLDPDLVMLNNGGVCPAPRVVIDAVKRGIEFDNRGPSYRMWRLSEPKLDSVRKRIAGLFGVGSDEIAIMRNATESLQTVILGLNLQSGDQVITSEQDYPRLITALRQRERRDGIKVVQVALPVVPTSFKQLLDPFESAITPRTRLILACQTYSLNGTTFPVADLCELGRHHKIPVVIDGAHGFARLPDKQLDIGCDFYGAALHKWLLGPIGTGFLYVRKPRIQEIWPLQPADPDLDGDIRKFEQFGTHPAALHNALDEAITFHEAIGIERKAKRFEYLKRRWVDKVRDLPNIKFQSSHDPAYSSGLTTIQIDKVPRDALASWLRKTHRLYVTTSHGVAGIDGIRITPNVYTSIEEIDRLATALTIAATKGIA